MYICISLFTSVDILYTGFCIQYLLGDIDKYPTKSLCEQTSVLELP